jgi:hypothetical protein
MILEIQILSHTELQNPNLYITMLAVIAQNQYINITQYYKLAHTPRSTIMHHNTINEQS